MHSSSLPKSDPAPVLMPSRVTVEELTVCSKDGGPSVGIRTFGNGAGIWVNTGNGVECVGLVAQQGVGPYLVIYGPHSDGLPPVAISKDGIQLPKEGNRHQPTVIPFKDLLEAVQVVMAGRHPQ